MNSITLDLHHVYAVSGAIDDALQQAFEEVIDKKIRKFEIVNGKSSGQLLKKVERFLQQPHIKRYYQRTAIDSKDKGKLVLYFKF